MSHRAAAAEAFPDSVAQLRVVLASAPLPPALRPPLDSLDWITLLPNRAAPGFVYLAGARRGTPVGGGGRDLAEAAGRLAGEASEALAQEIAPEPVDLPCEPALAALWGDGPCLRASDCAGSRAVGAPLSAIFPAFRGAEHAPPRSLGLAAGRDAGAARLAGLLELVERDAAAAWWNGAARPRAVCASELAKVGADLAAMRAGAEAQRRPTTFLVLPSIAELPVICAVSREAGGGGLVFGLKAALDLPAALAGATCELLQMEIALEIARLRTGQGRATAGDAQILRRAALDADGFAAFAPLSPAPAGAPSGFDGLVERLSEFGIEVFAADLPACEGGLAVAKTFAPGLQPLPGPGAAPRPGAPGAEAALV